MAYDNINYTPTKVPLGEEPKTGWARPNKDWEFIRNWYKNFPDWQSSLPKTDCTNSKHSVWYYHEFVPGVLVLPNLSRRPLRTRYNISSSAKSSRFMCNDSDLSFSSLNGSIEQNQKVWYQKLITTIRTILITTTTLFLNNNSSVRYENGIGGNDFSDEDVTDHQTFLIKKESLFKVMITKIFNASLETTKIFYAINRVMSVIGVFLLLHSRKIIGVRTTRRKNLALLLLLLLILGWLYAYGQKRSGSGISFDSKFVSFTYVWNSLLPSTLTATLLGIKSLFNKPFISKQEEDNFVSLLNVIPSRELKNEEINSNINNVLVKADFNVQALEKKYEDLSAIVKHLAQLDHKISQNQKEWELSTVNKLTKLQEDWSINAEQKLLQDQQHWKMDIESKLSKEQKNWEADAKASLTRMQKEWDLIAKETLSQQKSNWEESTKTNLLQIQKDLESSASLKLSQQQEDLEKLTEKKLLQLQKELKSNVEEKILQDQNDWKVNLESKLLQLQKDWELNVEASLQQQKLSDVNLKTKLVQQEGEERFISLQTEVDGILTELNSISNKIMELQTQINQKNVITHVSGADVCVDEIALPDYALFSSGMYPI
uniref:Uncharacterized protein n=1 Tax=Clastoptera arizonana TaxID=38151 RepID=A0A1B6CLF2_9HEMI